MESAVEPTRFSLKYKTRKLKLGKIISISPKYVSFLRHLSVVVLPVHVLYQVVDVLIVWKFANLVDKFLHLAVNVGIARS